MRFADLRIGAEFEFKVRMPGMAMGPWEKISPRKYRHACNGTESQVSTVNAEVVFTGDFETADKKKAEQIAAWLQSVGCYDCVPCTVYLGNSAYCGCSYKQDCKGAQGAPNPEPYTAERIYCLGRYPLAHDRAKVCYRRPDDSREWFLCAYLDPKRYAECSAEVKSQYHPFGSNFLLMPWEVPSGEKIDRYERKPYRRIDMAVLPAENPGK